MYTGIDITSSIILSSFLIKTYIPNPLAFASLLEYFQIPFPLSAVKYGKCLPNPPHGKKEGRGKRKEKPGNKSQEKGEKGRKKEGRGGG